MRTDAHSGSRPVRGNPPAASSSARAPRIICLAVSPPRNTTAGPLILHRHFARLADRYSVTTLHLDQGADARPGEELIPTRRWFHRGRFTRFGRHFAGLEMSRGWSIRQRSLLDRVRSARPDLLLVVAEDALVAASPRIARITGLPLVSVFHDWYPVWQDLTPSWRQAAERSLVSLGQTSRVTFCVSDPLRQRLGSPPQARLLPPIPDSSAPPVTAAREQRFHAVYAGRFHHFQRAEMLSLIGELQRRGENSLVRVFGPPPSAEDTLFAALRSAGIYRGFAAARAELDQALAAASALLVMLPFDPRHADFARFSFPSKLVEYCRFGRPIVVWGPADSAAVTWARRTGGAIDVTDSSPAALLNEIARLEAEPERAGRFGAAALRCAAGEFNPDVIQRAFEAGLETALGAGARE